jgi:hypothetical protein
LWDVESALRFLLSLCHSFHLVPLEQQGTLASGFFYLIMLLFMIGAVSGLLLVVLGIVALMQRRS